MKPTNGPASSEYDQSEDTQSEKYPGASLNQGGSAAFQNEFDCLAPLPPLS